MRATPTAIPEVLILEPRVFGDERGFFFESFNARAFEQATGLKREFAPARAVGPDALPQFKKYWAKENIPFVGLPDPDHIVAKTYKQEVNLFKLGRMPLNCIVDANGYIRYVHYSLSRP